MPDETNEATAAEPQAALSGGQPSVETQPAGAAEPAASAAQNAPKSAEEAVPSLMGSAKAEADKAQGGGQGGEQDAGAPDAYEAFKDENGEDWAPEQVKAFAETAKELNLSQEKTQKLFSAMFPSARGYLVNTHVKQVQEWTEASRADKEFGGQALDANLAIAKTALEHYASDDLRKVLRASGLDNHPEMIRLFWRIGKDLSQDTGVGGHASAPAKRVRYPNSNMVEDME